jgi:hypothetical protein
MPGIFISYRREDCPGHAGRIFDRLRSRFGSDVVFMDVTAIEAGVDFVEVLHKAVGSCDALLAIIGPQWLSASHDGKRRLDDPNDFVRIEIAGALERNVRVLPVLVEGASIPPTEGLPSDLHALTRRQAIELRDARWDDDIERLLEGLEKFLKVGESPHLTPSAAGADRSSAKKSPGRGLALAALVALILAIAATLAWRGKTATPASNTSPAPSETTASRPPEESASAKPAEQPPATSPVPAPALAPTPSPALAPTPSGRVNAPTPSASPANTQVPDVTGKTILEAREILRRAGFRFLIRIHDDRSKDPGIVETQRLDESTGSTQPRRVLLTAVAISTVLIHVVAGDEQKANDLATYLREQSSTIGTMVRVLSVVPRAELVGVVGYSEERLATQGAAIARDASEYLARAGKRRSLEAAVRPRVARGTIIVGLYERAP